MLFILGDAGDGRIISMMKKGYKIKERKKDKIYAADTSFIKKWF